MAEDSKATSTSAARLGLYGALGTALITGVFSTYIAFHKDSTSQQTERQEILSARIVDESTGKPISGVQVSLAGSAGHDLTDDNGNFDISVGVRPQEPAVRLILEKNGYLTVNRKVPIETGQTLQMRLRAGQEPRPDAKFETGSGAKVPGTEDRARISKMTTHAPPTSNDEVRSAMDTLNEAMLKVPTYRARIDEIRKAISPLALKTDLELCDATFSGVGQEAAAIRSLDRDNQVKRARSMTSRLESCFALIE